MTINPAKEITQLQKNENQNEESKCTETTDLRSHHDHEELPVGCKASNLANSRSAISAILDTISSRHLSPPSVDRGYLLSEGKGPHSGNPLCFPPCVIGGESRRGFQSA